jgi:hypothetical protein
VEWLGATRDVVIIAVALTSLAANVALIVLAWRMWVLVRSLREEVAPILESVRRTSETVRGTSTVVGDAVIRPVARLAGMAAAARTFSNNMGTILRGGLR